MHLSRRFILRVLFSFIFCCSSLIAVSQDNAPEEVVRGYQLFESKCLQCHTIPGGGNSTGPDLLGVTEKRSAEWLKSWIWDNKAFRETGDKDAIAIFKEWNGAAMNTFPEITDPQMENLLAYLAQPELIQQESTAVAVELSEEEEEGFSYINLVIIFIIVLVIVSLLISLKNSLKESLSEKTESMFQTVFNFVRVNRNMFVIGFIGFILMLRVVFNTLMGIGVYEGYQPDQPIEFSHKVHAGDHGIDCNYCHTSARNSKTASVPSVNLCMNCHVEIREGTNTGTKEIQKIYDAIGWDPDLDKGKGGYIENYDQKPIEWIRVHQLPDLTYFNHSQHVNVAGLECQQCHGAVEEKTVGQIAYSEELNEIQQNIDQGIEFNHPTLTMGWCIDCHRQKEIDMEENDYYTDMHKKIKSDPRYKDKKITPAMIGGMECGKCHY